MCVRGDEGWEAGDSRPVCVRGDEGQEAGDSGRCRGARAAGRGGSLDGGDGQRGVERSDSDIRLSLPRPSPCPSILSTRPQDPLAWQRGDASPSRPRVIETSLRPRAVPGCWHPGRWFPGTEGFPGPLQPLPRTVASRTLKQGCRELLTNGTAAR